MIKLGQMQLHSALDALVSWDNADDVQAYNTIGEHIGKSQSEYRIYCAWLLRERHGSAAAKFLVQLLTDLETRVHEYTFKLFEERLIEAELVELMLRRILESSFGGSSGGSALRSWHLIHFIRLLGARERFKSADVCKLYGSEIVRVLNLLRRQPHSLIRLEACKALIKYPEFLDIQSLARELQQDDDKYIKALGKRISTEGNSNARQ